MAEKHNDKPITELQHTLISLASKGAIFFLKFTCANCGARLMIDEPSTIFITGSCETCGHITDLEASGAGMAVLFGPPSNFDDIVLKEWGEKKEDMIRHAKFQHVIPLTPFCPVCGIN